LSGPALSASELPAQGRKSAGPNQSALGFVFGVVIASWIFYPWPEAATGIKIGDTVIAIAGTIVFFLVPADWRSRTFLLDFATARKAPWDIFILFGGGLSLAQAMQSTGLAVWMWQMLSIALVASLTLSAQSYGAETDWSQVDAVLGKTATVQGEIHRYGIPRTDLRVAALQKLAVARNR
jgi:hypothetical protein